MKSIAFTILLLVGVGSNHLFGQVDWSKFTTNLNMASRDTGGSGDTGGGGSGGADQGPDRPIGGGGLNEFVITADVPSTGSWVKEKTTLSWDAVGKAPYTVTVKQGRKEIFNASVNSTTCVIDFSNLAIANEDDYSISIVDADNKFKTNDIEVNFVDKSKLEASMASLEDDASYKASTGIKKHLMKAYFLEQQGFTLEAARAYNIATDNVEDMQLVLAMFRAFKARL